MLFSEIKEWCTAYVLRVFSLALLYTDFHCHFKHLLFMTHLRCIEMCLIFLYDLCYNIWLAVVLRCT